MSIVNNLISSTDRNIDNLSESVTAHHRVYADVDESRVNIEYCRELPNYTEIIPDDSRLITVTIDNAYLKTHRHDLALGALLDGVAFHHAKAFNDQEHLAFTKEESRHYLDEMLFGMLDSGLEVQFTLCIAFNQIIGGSIVYGAEENQSLVSKLAEGMKADLLEEGSLVDTSSLDVAFAKFRENVPDFDKRIILAHAELFADKSTRTAILGNLNGQELRDFWMKLANTSVKGSDSSSKLINRLKNSLRDPFAGEVDIIQNLKLMITLLTPLVSHSKMIDKLKELKDMSGNNLDPYLIAATYNTVSGNNMAQIYYDIAQLKQLNKLSKVSRTLLQTLIGKSDFEELVALGERGVLIHEGPLLPNVNVNELSDISPIDAKSGEKTSDALLFALPLGSIQRKKVSGTFNLVSNIKLYSFLRFPGFKSVLKNSVSRLKGGIDSIIEKIAFFEL